MKHMAKLFTVSLLMAGCTTEAWYEGMRRKAENDCRAQPAGAAEECLARLNTRSYGEYEKERTRER